MFSRSGHLPRIVRTSDAQTHELNTNVHSFSCSASVTFNFATPMESAVTPFHNYNFLRYGSSTAAHDAAIIYRTGRLVAVPAVGALYAELGIFLTETRRDFVIDQILNTGRFVFWVEWFQLKAVLVLPSTAFSLRMNAVGHDRVHFRMLGQPATKNNYKISRPIYTYLKWKS